MEFVVTGIEWIAAGAGRERAGDSADVNTHTEFVDSSKMSNFCVLMYN